VRPMRSSRCPTRRAHRRAWSSCPTAATWAFFTTRGWPRRSSHTCARGRCRDGRRSATGAPRGPSAARRVAGFTPRLPHGRQG
jgi:hypothetical protein